MPEDILVKYPYMIRTNKLIALSIVLAFSIASLFGAYLTMSHGMHSEATPCPFSTDSATACPMSMGAHVNEWQQLFFAVFDKSILTLLIIAAFFAGAIVLRYFRELASPRLIPIRLDQTRGGTPYYKDYLSNVIGSGIFHKRE